MNLPPPFQVPSLIVSLFPQLLFVPATQQSIIRDAVSNAPGFDTFLALIQQQGPPSPTGGWARQEPFGLSLSADTLNGVTPLLAQVLTAAMQDSRLESFCWTVQSGLVPGPEPTATSTTDWTLNALPPNAGLELTSIQYTGATQTFSLRVGNRVARHLGVMVRFLQNGTPISPAGWSSRLPVGVASVYESDTLKFLAILNPQTPVAGIPVSTDPQSLTVALPPGAETVELLFGGLGNGSWELSRNGVGVVLTLFLDCVVPAVAALSGQTVTQKWYENLINSAEIRVELLNWAANLGLAASAPLPDVLGQLAAQIPAALPTLTKLSAALVKAFGQQTVSDATPLLGWPAALVAALLQQQEPVGESLFQATSPLLSSPTSIPVRLSPATTVALELKLQAPGVWPFRTSECEVSIRDAQGYSQQTTVAVNPAADPLRLPVTFGSVRNAGPVSVEALVTDSEQQVLARGATAAIPACSGRSRIVAADVSLKSLTVVIDAQTQYVHAATLAYQSPQFVWDTSAPPPSAVTSTAPVGRLVQLSAQQSAFAIGLVWSSSGQSLQTCGTGVPLQTAFQMQNLGMVNPALQLQSMNCGLSSAPLLAYDPTGAASGGYYLDPRPTQPCLRPVAFVPGPWNLQGSVSVGRFRENVLADLALHPGGYAAAISWTNSRLEVVKLLETAVPDVNAPLSRILAGPGERAGLLQDPVAIAVQTDGLLLVLEQGNARVQCLDVHGNPTAVFGGSPFLPLPTTNGATLLDLAVSPSGRILILSSENGGAHASDFFVDVYTGDGTLICRTSGIAAARLAVGPGESLYTLNFSTIAGPADLQQPSVSLWLPSGDRS